MKRLLAVLALFVMLSVPCAAGTFAVWDSEKSEQSEIVQEPEILVSRQGVEVKNPGNDEIEVRVFAITGVLATQCAVAAGESVVIELSAGYYIVRAAAVAKRVVVR